MGDLLERDVHSFPRPDVDRLFDHVNVSHFIGLGGEEERGTLQWAIHENLLSLQMILCGVRVKDAPSHVNESFDQTGQQRVAGDGARQAVRDRVHVTR